MHRADVDLLDLRRTYWVASVIAPCSGWCAIPGCYPGARFLIDRHTLRPQCDGFAAFSSKLSCLLWIMRHRSEINHALPGGQVSAVRLDRWLLGLE